MATSDGAQLLPRALAEIARGMKAGWHKGAQLFVSRAGRRVADLGVGESRPGVAMTPDTLNLWMSSGKPIGAAAIMQLVERGLLDLDQPVAETIPEFAAGGKQDITPRHILTHTCGFRWIDLAWETSSWDQIIARLCAGKQERDWTPGTKAGYHPTTSWYILGELIRRIDGRPYSQYVRDEIFAPLGMVDAWVGMPLEQFRAYGDRFSPMPETSKPEGAPQRYSSERGATECVPGGNAMGPMHDLGRFYQMLLAGGLAPPMAGDALALGQVSPSVASSSAAPPSAAPPARRILGPESVRLLTTPQRIGMYDQTFRHIMDWSLGLIMSSNRYGDETAPYGYGVDCSDRTFGHGGSQSSVAFADPEYDLVVAVVMSGMPGEAIHHGRMRAFLAALYQDLGLA